MNGLGEYLRDASAFVPKASLNIIEEYYILGPRHKSLLFQALFVDGPDTFDKTARVFWPEVEAQDLKKLKNFLILVKQTLE